MYAILFQLSIEANRYIEMGDLMLLGIGEEVQGLVTRIGWNKFLGKREPTMKEQLLEFLATFTFYKMNHIDYD